MQDRKNKIVAKHAKGVEFLMKKNKVDWIKGYGTLQPRGGNGCCGGGRNPATASQTLETKNIILATGSEARMLPGLEPDAKTILTNIEILNLPAIPKTHADHRRGRGGRGVRVHLPSLRNQSHGARDAAAHRAGRGRGDFQRTGAVFQEKAAFACETGAKAENITQARTTACRMCVTLANGKQEDMEAETLLVAVGRKPNHGQDRTREYSRSSWIAASSRWMSFSSTGEPGVYAIGDVVAGTPQLAHVATMEGMVAVAHIAGKPAKPINRNRIPSCTYTEPGIGSVGLTEAQARAQGRTR